MRKIAFVFSCVILLMSIGKAQVTVPFAWLSSVVPGFPSTYELQIARDAGFTAPIVADFQGLTDTTKAAVGSLFLAATNYYWRVNASNTGGTSPWSAVWTFQTAPSAPAAPTLITPANGATQVKIQ